MIERLLVVNERENEPNAETLAAFAEVDEMKRTGSGQKLHNLEDLWNSLED